jgi:Porin subfamily
MTKVMRRRRSVRLIKTRGRTPIPKLFIGTYIPAVQQRAELRKSADYSCNPDYNVYQIGAVTRWTPVKNLTLSAEVQYFMLDQKYTCMTTLTNMPPKPNTVYEFRDQSAVSVNVRAHRNF